MLIPLLLIQSAAGPFLPAAPRPKTDQPCPVATDNTDVVVCARNQESFRLRPVAPLPEKQLLPKAETRIGNAALAAEAEQATLAGGQQSQRLMMRLKLPLGRKKQP